jgi:hypothetical protein
MDKDRRKALIDEIANIFNTNSEKIENDIEELERLTSIRKSMLVNMDYQTRKIFRKRLYVKGGTQHD